MSKRQPVVRISLPVSVISSLWGKLYIVLGKYISVRLLLLYCLTLILSHETRPVFPAVYSVYSISHYFIFFSYYLRLSLSEAHFKRSVISWRHFCLIPKLRIALKWAWNLRRNCVEIPDYPKTVSSF